MMKVISDVHIINKIPMIIVYDHNFFMIVTYKYFV